MKIVCAWCNKELSNKVTAAADEQISHGICDACAARVLANPGETMLDFLDRLEAPVLAVLPDVKVFTANKRAQKFLGKGLGDLRTYRGGEVIECHHAHLGEGCGKTVHCQSCTIRRTVTETFATGKSRTNVPAYPDIQVGAEVKTVSLLISTRKFGNFVLLQIDEPGGEDSKRQA